MFETDVEFISPPELKQAARDLATRYLAAAGS
jgi:hypothetical protein